MLELKSMITQTKCNINWWKFYRIDGNNQKYVYKIKDKKMF